MYGGGLAILYLPPSLQQMKYYYCGKISEYFLPTIRLSLYQCQDRLVRCAVLNNFSTVTLWSAIIVVQHVPCVRRCVIIALPIRMYKTHITQLSVLYVQICDEYTTDFRDYNNISHCYPLKDKQIKFF